MASNTFTSNQLYTNARCNFDVTIDKHQTCVAFAWKTRRYWAVAGMYVPFESKNNYGNFQCNAPFVDSEKCPHGIHTYRRMRSKTFRLLSCVVFFLHFFVWKTARFSLLPFSPLMLAAIDKNRNKNYEFVYRNLNEMRKKSFLLEVSKFIAAINAQSVHLRKVFLTELQ